MDVDYSFGVLLDELWAEDSHVADEDDEVDAVFFEGGCNFFIEFFAGEAFGGDVDCGEALFAGSF